MFCPNCGTNIPDGQKFCANCGARVAAPEAPVYTRPAAPAAPPAPAYTPPAAPKAPEAPVYTAPAAPKAPEAPVYTAPAAPKAPEYTAAPSVQQPYAQPQYPPQYAPQPDMAATQVKKKSGKKTLIIIIGVIVLLAAAAAVLYFCVFNKSGGYIDYNDLLDDYFDAFEDAERKDIYKLFPKKLRDAYKDLEGSADPAAFLDRFDDWSDDYGKDIDSWSIEAISEYGSAELAALKDMFGSMPEQYVDITVDVKFENGTAYTIDLDLMLLKDGWYLIQVW